MRETWLQHQETHLWHEQDVDQRSAVSHDQDLRGGIHLDLLLEGQRLHVYNSADSTLLCMQQGADAGEAQTEGHSVAMQQDASETELTTFSMHRIQKL